MIFLFIFVNIKNNYYQILNNLYLSDLSEPEMEMAAKVIYEHKEEFDEYHNKNLKLAAVKALKEHAGLGLREAKHFMDLIFDKKIKITSLKEERRKKLERLAKIPLVEEIIKKFRNHTDEEISTILMTLTIDELFLIDEKTTI